MMVGNSKPLGMRIRLSAGRQTTQLFVVYSFMKGGKLVPHYHRHHLFLPARRLFSVENPFSEERGGEIPRPAGRYTPRIKKRVSPEPGGKRSFLLPSMSNDLSKRKGQIRTFKQFLLPPKMRVCSHLGRKKRAVFAALLIFETGPKA